MKRASVAILNVQARNLEEYFKEYQLYKKNLTFFQNVANRNILGFPL
jgi:hypothetical protein